MKIFIARFYRLLKKVLVVQLFCYLRTAKNRPHEYRRKKKRGIVEP